MTLYSFGCLLVAIIHDPRTSVYPTGDKLSASAPTPIGLRPQLDELPSNPYPSSGLHTSSKRHPCTNYQNVALTFSYSNLPSYSNPPLGPIGHSQSAIHQYQPPSPALRMGGRPSISVLWDNDVLPKLPYFDQFSPYHSFQRRRRLRHSIFLRLVHWIFRTYNALLSRSWSWLRSRSFFFSG